MTLYAAAPARRLRQVLGDLLLIGWIAAWVWVGRLVQDTVVRLADPVVGIQSRASDLGRTMRDASSSVGDLPMVGDTLKVPFDKASGTGDGIARSSGDLVAQIQQIGWLLGLLTAAVPILLVTLWWVSRRVAFVRAATAAQRYVDSEADLDLFALRAMARQPLERLTRISPDPVGAWRRGDPEVVHALALMELREQGLRPPPPRAASPR